MMPTNIGQLDASASKFLRERISRIDSRARGVIEHTDANETAFLPRDLLGVDPQQYQELLAAIKGRRYFPAIAGIPEHAMSHAYRMWTLHGQATAGTQTATVTPVFSATVKEKISNIVALPGHYEWTVDEINAARAVGSPLDEMTTLSAHSGLERKCDNMIAVGDSSRGIEGALNYTGINSTTVITGAWATATADQILADVFKMVSELLDGLNQAAEAGLTDVPAFERFTLLVPVKQDLQLMKPRSSTSDTSVKKWLLNNLEHVEAIEPWWQCKGRGDSASDRSMLYPRNPLFGGSIVNQEFTSLAPQAQDHKIRVPCQMKCGGAVFRYPVAARYMDHI